MSKYNFSNYWKESYTSLLQNKSMIEREVNDIQDKFIKRDEYSATMPTIVHEDLSKYYAELDYLKRVIFVRRFWSPKDWINAIAHFFKSIHFKIYFFKYEFQRNREKRLSEEARIPYYRSQVQKIEKQLLKMFPEINSDCSWSESKEFADLSPQVKDKIKNLLSQRCYYLDHMFRATDMEVKRINEVNDHLRQLTSLLKKQTTEWNSKSNEMFKDSAWEIDNEANLIWAPEGEGTILPFVGEDYYGSNFESMIYIEKVVHSDSSLEPCASIVYWITNDNDKQETKVIGDLDSEINDWKEGLWRRPELELIQLCHAFHQMNEHLEIPIADILHVNSYYLELKRGNTLYLDIFSTHHPKGYGTHYRREEYEEAMKKMI